MKWYKNPAWTTRLSIALLIAGCLQVAGYFLKSRALRGIGFAYAIAPLPTVFGTVKGVEGFSTQPVIQFTGLNGQTDSILLDGHLFNQFHGSYLLKNAYCIFLAYPTMLKSAHVSGTVDYLLCRHGIEKQFWIRDSMLHPILRIHRIKHDVPEIITLQPDCEQP